MMKESINFFSEEIKFNLRDKIKIRKWILLALKKEKKSIDSINYIFCSDSYLLKLNKTYLGHNYLTDVITFDFRNLKLEAGSWKQEAGSWKLETGSKKEEITIPELPNNFSKVLNFGKDEKLSGDIYISIDRVKENAKEYSKSFYPELHRVIIHGVLHLAGYDDITLKDKKLMSSKEDNYLSLLSK